MTFQPCDGQMIYQGWFLIFLTNAQGHSVRCTLLGGQFLQIDGTDGLLTLHIEWDD
jgi:hypothetical protein